MVDFVELSNKRTNSVRTIRRTLSRICSADFQTLFSKFSAESQPAICRDTNDKLTEREGRTGEYWPEVVAVRTERSEVRTKRPRANIPRYGSS